MIFLTSATLKGEWYHHIDLSNSVLSRALQTTFQCTLGKVSSFMHNYKDGSEAHIRTKPMKIGVNLQLEHVHYKNNPEQYYFYKMNKGRQ